MFKKASYLIPLAILGACAYAIDDSIQDVHFVTPGAHGAACNVYVEGLKYKVKPPQTVNLFKSKEDLVVDCMAPGNRRKILYIESGIETSTAWNVTNAGVGLPWDYASGALFHYPDVIEVDFTNEPVVDPEPPAQNRPDIRQPEEYILEEFSPSEPMMNEDRNNPPIEILRREGASSSANTIMNEAAVFSEPVAESGSNGSTSASGKGNLMDAADGIQSSTYGPSQGNAGGPVPLLPPSE